LPFPFAGVAVAVLFRFFAADTGLGGGTSLDAAFTGSSIIAVVTVGILNGCKLFIQKVYAVGAIYRYAKALGQMPTVTSLANLLMRV